MSNDEPQRRRFHVSVRARPKTISHGEPIILNGETCRPLQLDAAGLSDTLPLTFEDALERMNALPRMFCELDGAFVWAGEGPPKWQVDGVLYDGPGRLQYVEMNGSCPEPLWDQLSDALGWSDFPLLFEWPAQGVYLDEADFRRCSFRP